MYHKAPAITTFTRQVALLILLLVCLLANSGCYYYKSAGHNRSTTRPKRFCKVLRAALSPDKYVIIHQGNDMWYMENTATDVPDKQRCPADYNISYTSLAEVDSLPAGYYNSYRQKGRRAQRYRLADEDYVISQVHLYTSDANPPAPDMHSFPASSITRIEVYQQATGRTAWSWSMLNLCIDIIMSGGGSHHGHNHTHHSSSTSHTPTILHGPRKR